MDLAGLKIKPLGDNVAVKFVDDDDGDESSEGVPYEGVLAIVVGVGPNAKGVKVGDTVITRPYARDGLKLGDNIVMCSAWDIAGTVS